MALAGKTEDICYPSPLVTAMSDEAALSQRVQHTLLTS
jgi:hypothetical protein